MKRSLHSNANAGGGGYGYPAGPPAHASQHQQTQQQYSQQPQFRGQWNDYGSRNNNQYSQPQYSEYSQTQQTQPSQPLDTRRADHYQHHIRHDTSRSDNPNNYSSQLTNDHSMSQPAGQQPKRLRATKRRLRQPLSGPAGIWFRMNKKEQAKDSKEGIKTERKSGAGDDAISGDDDTFGYEEAGVIAHQAHQAMAEHNRRERERREEEEMKGSGGDEDDVEEMLDEETGQICKVPEGTVSTFEAVLGRAWDVMCICMDRIVPDSSIFVQNHQRQPYREIRSALDDSPCGKLRHFSLLSEILGRDGPNRDIGIPGSGGALRVGHLVVSIASVHNNNHCDWTVELRDETVTTSPSSSGGRDGNAGAGGGRDGDSNGAIGIKGWIAAQLLKDHPEWVRPGVVLYLKDAACTVFEAVKAGGLDDIGGPGGAQGGPGGNLAGNGLERMLLINESSVVCAWLPESHMDRQDFLTLIEKRNTARDATDEIKEEVTDLTQDEKPSVPGVTFEASPPSTRTESNMQPKPNQTELSEISEVQKMKTSSTQEEEDAAIDLTSDDIGDKENQTKSDAFIAENVESVGDTINTTASSPPVIGQGTSTIEATSSVSASTGSQQESSHRKQQGREALSHELDRPSGVQGELSQESSIQQEKVCLEKQNMVSNDPCQKLSSAATPHVSVPNNSTDDPASANNDTLGGESLPSSLPEAKHTDTTAASSIWAAGVDSGKEETGDDSMFSSGLSSTQDEAFSPMPPSKDTRSSTETGEAGLPAAKASHSAAGEKFAGTSTGVSGIFAGGCDMLDDLDEDEDDDF